MPKGYKRKDLLQGVSGLQIERLNECRREIQSAMSVLQDVVVVFRYLRIVVVEARRKFGNPEEEERLPLEPVTRRLVKTQLTAKNKCLL
jgi:hypothetical protein